MTKFLYKVVGLIAVIHNYILTLNDLYEYDFNDKELHFLVIGLLGIFLVFALYPIFKYLAKNNRIMSITFIFVFSQIVVITFAIEIGQKITHTGEMEFADIVWGISGFLLVYTLFNLVIGGVKAIVKFLKKKMRKSN